MRTFLVLPAALALLTGQAATQPAPAAKRIHEWWHEAYVASRPLKSPNAKKLPLLSVRGNRFVDPQGNPVLIRGLAISDPDKVEAQGHWNREHFVKVQETGARLVRLPVHPIAWRERTPAAYLKLLDQAVEWCTELGMYVMIDWHSIGNLKSGLFQDPMYETSLAETNFFWKTVAAHFAGHNTPAFYEFFNEPTTFSDQLGPMAWEDWKRINEDLVALVRAYDREKIPLVAGFDWAYDLTPLRMSPIAAEGIGYTTHPYSHKRSKPWEPKWEEDFGFAAGRYPVLATEFGLMGRQDREGGYGPSIIKYLEGRGIGWVGWVFDPEWGPPLLRSWDTYALTEAGEFFRDALQGKLK
jgi:endoglucanase